MASKLIKYTIVSCNEYSRQEFCKEINENLIKGYQLIGELRITINGSVIQYTQVMGLYQDN